MVGKLRKKGMDSPASAAQWTAGDGSLILPVCLTGSIIRPPAGRATCPCTHDFIYGGITMKTFSSWKALCLLVLLAALPLSAVPAGAGAASLPADVVAELGVDRTDPQGHICFWINGQWICF